MRSPLITMLGSLLIIALCAAGISGSAWIAHDLWLAVEATGWQPVPAQVLTATLESRSSRPSGRRRRSRSTTTYEVLATYRYTVDGRIYENDAIGISSFGRDNLGSWHQQWYDVLNRHRTSGEPLTIYVDQQHPERALVDREPRWAVLTMIGGLAGVMGAIGFTGARIFLSDLLRRQRRIRAMAEHPGKPWLWRPDWAAGRIRADGGGGRSPAIGWSLGALASALPTSAMAWLGLCSGGAHLLLVAALLIPLACSAWAAVLWRRWRRFGHLELHCDPVPVAPGGHLDLSLRTGIPRSTVTLLHLQVSSTSPSQVIYERAATSDEIGQQHGLLTVRLGLDLPADLRASAPPEGPIHESASHTILTLTIRCGGPDLALRFALPVFRPPVPAVPAS